MKRNRADLEESVMILLVGGWSVPEVAQAARIGEPHVGRIMRRLMRKAERDIQLARLTLWREGVRAA